MTLCHWSSSLGAQWGLISNLRPKGLRKLRYARHRVLSRVLGMGILKFRKFVSSAIRQRDSILSSKNFRSTGYVHTETNSVCYLFSQLKLHSYSYAYFTRWKKITHGLFGPPWGLGALGPDPLGPLDKTALNRIQSSGIQALSWPTVKHNTQL